MDGSQQRRLQMISSDYPNTIFESTNALLTYVEALDPMDVLTWSAAQRGHAVGYIHHCTGPMCADPMAVIPGHPGGPHIVYMLAQSDTYLFLLEALFEACHSADTTAEVDLPRAGVEEFLDWIGRDASYNAECIAFITEELAQFYTSITEVVTDAGYEAPVQQPFVYTGVSGPYVFRQN